MRAFLGDGPWSVSFEVLAPDGTVLLAHQCRNVTRWRSASARAKRRLLEWGRRPACQFYDAALGGDPGQVTGCGEESGGTVLLPVPGGAVDVNACERHRAQLEATR